MLIRKPVAEVFEAFVDPAITSNFWFSKGSTRLEAGKELEQDRRILIEWPGDGAPTTVEWTFRPRPDNSTFVSIANTGFAGDDDAIIEQIVGSTEGFTLVLAGLKAFLEKGIALNLVADRFPDGLPLVT